MFNSFIEPISDTCYHLLFGVKGTVFASLDENIAFLILQSQAIMKIKDTINSFLVANDILFLYNEKYKTMKARISR